MKIISIQVHFKGICISQTNADRAKVYFEVQTYKECKFFYISLKTPGLRDSVTTGFKLFSV